MKHPFRPARLGVVLALTSLALTGCASGSTPGTNDTPGTQSQAASACRRIEMVIPYAPGGSSDLSGRALAAAAESASGITITIVNRDGSNGTIATSEMAKQKADPCKVILLPNGVFTATPYTRDVTYAIDDFQGVVAMTQEDIILAVNSGAKWKSIADMKADTGHRFTYGHSGTGSFLHLAQAEFYEGMGLDSSSVPFGGSAPAVTALLGNQVDSAAAHPGELKQYVEAGSLIPLAVFSDQPSEFFPDVPTAASQGVDVQMSVWKFLLMHKDVPEESRSQMEEIFTKAAEQDSYKNTIKDLNAGLSIKPGSQVIADLKSQAEANKELFEQLGITKQ